MGRVPIGGGRGGAAGNIFAVRVVLDGGSAGDGDNDCTYTYAIHRYSDAAIGPTTLIASGIEVDYRMARPGKYHAAEDGSVGIAYTTVSGGHRLFFVQETLWTANCECS